MKKVLKVLSASMLSALVAVSAVATVSAAAGINDAEQQVLDSLNAGIELESGEVLEVPPGRINEAENYFAQDDVDLDQEQAGSIVAQIDAAKDYIIETGITSWSELDDSMRSELISFAQSAADDAGLEVSISADGNVSTATGGNNDGNTTKPDNSGVNANSGGVNVNGNPIQTTGFDVPSVAAVAGVGILMVSAAGIYLAKASKKESVDA